MTAFFRDHFVQKGAAAASAVRQIMTMDIGKAVSSVAA
jgi:hypothetical protein